MSESAPRAPLKMWTYEQFDGSVWRNYQSPEAFFMLTGVGRKLIAGGQIGRLLRSYAEDYQEGSVSAEGMRRFIARGVGASVFGVGSSRLVVKEKDPNSRDDLFAALNRMDKLIDAIHSDPKCPKWIDVPQHYGIVSFKDDPCRQFMLMEKIDEGVSAGDILYYHNRSNDGKTNIYRPLALRQKVDEVYGPITDEFTETIAGMYGMALGHIRRALLAKYLSPDEFLPDLDHNPHNILIEPLPEPIDGMPVKFWIIDQ